MADMSMGLCLAIDHTLRLVLWQGFFRIASAPPCASQPSNSRLVEKRMRCAECPLRQDEQQLRELPEDRCLGADVRGRACGWGALPTSQHSSSKCSSTVRSDECRFPSRSCGLSSEMPSRTFSIRLSKHSSVVSFRCPSMQCICKPIDG